MAEITKTTPDRPFSVSNYIWILLVVLTIAAYFAGLNLPLVGPDEPRYAQVAREMFERGDWVTPTLGGHTWFEKPALLYWLQIAAYHLFGVTEFAARVGPAMSGLGTVAAMYLLGRSTGRDGLGRWLAVLTASTLGIVVFAHGASFDILITFTLTAALSGFFWFDRTGKRQGLVIFYASIGLALLAKGLIGVVFPFAIVGFYHVLSWKLPSRPLIMSLVWGMPLFVGIAAIWYAPAYMRNGWPFINEFIVQHHFQRFTSNKYQHPQPFYFFLWVLPLMTLPWLGFWVAGLAKFGRALVGREGELKAKDTFDKSLVLLCLAWVAVPLVFFSFSGSKLPGYILPAVPGAVVIAAAWIVQASRKWQLLAMGTAIFVLVGTIVVVFTVGHSFAEEESFKPLATAAAARGFGDDRVFAVHTTPHGAEFYAPGRILRDAAGNQRKIYSGPELKTEMERAGVSRALAVVPANYPDDLTVHKQLFRYELLASNGELAIYSVELLGGSP